MTEIDRVLKRAALRLAAVSFLRLLVMCLTAVAAAMLLMRLGERALAFVIDWTSAWIIAASLGVSVALIWTLFTKPARLEVARRVDAGAALRESLSTAVCVQGRSDPWSRAAVDQAGDAARRVVIRDAIEIPIPRQWWLPPLLAIAFLVAGFIPQGDLLKLLSGRAAREAKQTELIEAKAQVQAMNEQLKDALSKIDEKLPAQAEDGLQPDQPATPQEPDDLRRDQMKKLTTIEERLNDLRSSDQAKAMDELKTRLEGLRQPSEGSPQELNAMAQALQRGDLKSASAELSKLMEKAATNKLTDQEKAQMAKTLEGMAKQLEKLAAESKDLERKLAESGLDKSLAADPEALSKALEQAKHLTDEQKKQLSQQCQACKSAGGKLGELAKAMQKSASGGKGTGKQGAGSGMGDMSEQLSQLEMAESQLAELEMAQNAVKGQLQQLGQSMCEGGAQGKPGENPQWKNGPRGNSAGRANGGGGRSVEADFELNKQKVKGPNQGGPIIGTEMLEGGEQVRGEAKQAFTDAVTAGEKAATEAIENKQIPREYHEAVKNYFGRLEKKAKPAASSPSAATPAATPTPVSGEPVKK